MDDNSNLQVSYFGIPGSFTHKAACKYFNNQSSFLSEDTFEGVFRSVNNKVADYGVVPIENTLAGSIYENYDNLSDYNVHIVGEISLEVKHYLLTKKSSSKKSIDQIRYVYSHQKALEQCSVFLSEHSHMKAMPYNDTANAAKFIAESHDDNLAAIADKNCAGIYQLKVLASNIENNKYNITRFIVFSNSKSKNIQNNNKCSLIITLPHTAGSLDHVLKLFAAAKCNLTKIESRPLQMRPFEYTFYLDFTFSDLNLVNRTIDLVSETTNSVRVLGVYEDERLQY